MRSSDGLKRGAYCAAEDAAGAADDAAGAADEAAGAAELRSVAGAEGAVVVVLLSAGAVTAGLLLIVVLSAGAIGVVVLLAGAVLVTGGTVLFTVVVDGCELAENTR